MGNEEEIHKIYQRFQNSFPSPSLYPAGGASVPANKYSINSEIPRWNFPSFRSSWFDLGNGLVTIAPGETETLALKNVPIGHLGVLTGFTQYFADSDELIPTIVNSVSWGIRINGNPIPDFPDFIGQLSQPYLVRQVFYPLLGQTAGSVSTSPGGSPAPGVSSVSFQATNLYNISVVLAGRLIGWTFPIDERNDEFGAY